MSNDDYARELDRLRAELAQQRRLVAGLQNQTAKLLDQVARLLAEADKGKKKAKNKEKNRGGKPTGGNDAAAPPTPPERTEEDDDPAKGTPRRGPLPADLPREVERHVVDPNGVSCCATPLLEERDPEVQERRDLVKAHARVHRIELHRAQCVCCGAMHTAEQPPVAMPNGSMTAALIAFIVNGKCGLHLPLARIIGDLAEKGLTIPKTTMSNVMRHASNLLTPIVDRIVAALFESDVLHLDGTGINTLEPGQPGKHRGQIAVCCNELLTAYIYSVDKAGQHLLDFLGVGTDKGFRGRLVADAANNMDRIYADGRITECGCWYHARAKFEDALASSPAAAHEAIAWIGTLFDVDEAAAKAGDTATERRARRKRFSIPLLRGFYRWMRAMQARFTPDEDLWKAVQYCFNHWRALTRFMVHGDVPMTNNLAERELGPIGRGRKNWLHAGSDDGGTWLANLYTVVRTCVRLAIAPDDYLAWVLPKLSDLPVNRGKGHLADLTPMAYAKLHTAS